MRMKPCFFACSSVVSACAAIPDAASVAAAPSSATPTRVARRVNLFRSIIFGPPSVRNGTDVAGSQPKMYTSLIDDRQFPLHNARCDYNLRRRLGRNAHVVYSLAAIVMTERLSLAAVLDARRAIAPLALRTPALRSDALSARAGHDVFLKLETMQPTGAF